MSARNESIKVATTPLECNASLFIQGCLDDIIDQLTFTEKRAVVIARSNGWEIQPGDSYRYYEWNSSYVDEDTGELVVDDEAVECCEIPAMAAICTRLQLWP